MRGKKRLIIVHPNFRGAPCFDVYGDDRRRGYRGYEMPECSFVKEEGLRGYSWSDDLEHIPAINREVQETINRLVRRGWRIEFRGWEMRRNELA